MSETAVTAPSMGTPKAALTLQAVPPDSMLNVEILPPNEDEPAGSAPGQKAVKTFAIHEASCSTDIKEVHCNGLHSYQILRKAVRPDRPMVTILDLQSGQIVAGTKAGRRECHHIFVGNPEVGTTVWLPVTRSTSGWSFDAVDRVLEWRELSRTEEACVGDTFELFDLVTSEALARYCEASGGVELRLHCHMETPLVLLVLASTMAILERTRTQELRDGDRKSSTHSSPGLSRPPPARSQRS